MSPLPFPLVILVLCSLCTIDGYNEAVLINIMPIQVENESSFSQLTGETELIFYREHLHNDVS